MTDTLILRTRPTTVEAKQVNIDNREELARWVSGWTYGHQAVRWFDRDNGVVTDAKIGDWIVKTAFGNYVRVSDAALLGTYDRVSPAVSE